MAPSAKKNGKEKKSVEVVVFDDPDKPRNKPKPQKESAAVNKNRLKLDMGIQRPVFDQRAAMYDIRKLAMTGMQKEDKEEAMVNYLVELGAKRPKGKPIPMKEYIEELKKRKLEGDTKPEGGRGERNTKKQNSRKRDKKDIFIDGQIGKWKRGVQFINPGKKFHKGT